MTKRKRTKGKTMIYKTLHRKLNIEQHKPHSKRGGELRCSGWVRNFCFTCGASRVNLITNHVMVQTVKLSKCLLQINHYEHVNQYIYVSFHVLPHLTLKVMGSYWHPSSLKACFIRSGAVFKLFNLNLLL